MVTRASVRLGLSPFARKKFVKHWLVDVQRLQRQKQARHHLTVQNRIDDINLLSAHGSTALCQISSGEKPISCPGGGTFLKFNVVKTVAALYASPNTEAQTFAVKQEEI